MKIAVSKALAEAEQVFDDANAHPDPARHQYDLAEMAETFLNRRDEHLNTDPDEDQRPPCVV